MPYFVYLTPDKTVRMAEGEPVPYQFPTYAAAEVYRRQLEAHYGYLPADPSEAFTPARQTTRRPRRPLACSNGRQYPSAAAAAADIGVSPSAISQHMTDRTRYGSVKGLTLWYMEPEPNA